MPPPSSIGIALLGACLSIQLVLIGLLSATWLSWRSQLVA
jgi:hypothetical protein